MFGKPAFCIIGDDVTYPSVARKFARHESLAFSRLADAFERDGSPDAANDECYTFPDNSRLLMIGKTKELEDACKEADAAGLRRIATRSHRVMGLRFVRMEVSPIQTDTLIAIGAQDSLPAWSPDGWREHKRPWAEDYALTADRVDLIYSLPPMIRGIEEFYDDAWYTKM
jgi:hypothetical protein